MVIILMYSKIRVHRATSPRPTVELQYPAIIPRADYGTLIGARGSGWTARFRIWDRGDEGSGVESRAVRSVAEATWTFQVAPEAGWARRKGPVTLRARLMPTAAPRTACRSGAAVAAHACSLSAPVHLRPNSVNKNYDAWELYRWCLRRKPFVTQMINDWKVTVIRSKLSLFTELYLCILVHSLMLYWLIDKYTHRSRSECRYN